MLNLLRRVYRPLRSIINSIILYNKRSTIFVILEYVTKYRKYKAMPAVRKGFEDHRPEVATGNTEYMTIFKRVADAYNKAKEEQKNIAQPYRVGSQWQRKLDSHLDTDFFTALRGSDTRKLQAMLENFHRERFSMGLVAATDYSGMKTKPLWKYLFVNTWYKHYNICQEVMGIPPRLNYPMVGNPVGLFYEGQVIPIEAIRFYYCAEEILSLLQDVKNPVVCEIGGGLGGQAYAVLSNSERAITYVYLDIPEVLLTASYFLMAALPEKKVLLYGEGQPGPDKLDEYDMILMPNFVLPQLADETVDLFFNANSFSEMNSETVEEYLRQIERICRRYLMHINHNTQLKFYEDGKEIYNTPSTQMKIDTGRFKKIYQHPWLFTTLSTEVYYKGTGPIAFLYERRRTIALGERHA